MGGQREGRGTRGGSKSGSSRAWDQEGGGNWPTWLEEKHGQPGCRAGAAFSSRGGVLVGQAGVLAAFFSSMRPLDTRAPLIILGTTKAEPIVNTSRAAKKATVMRGSDGGALWPYILRTVRRPVHISAAVPARRRRRAGARLRAVGPRLPSKRPCSHRGGGARRTWRMPHLWRSMLTCSPPSSPPPWCRCAAAASRPPWGQGAARIMCRSGLPSSRCRSRHQQPSSRHCPQRGVNVR